ncbi:MAG: DUF1997 domain-containing protein [Cyanobacteria bacterium P01_F01_bin.3]
MVRFSASQAVTISVPPQPHSIEAYLCEVDRLVYALVDAKQVQVLGPNLFRVKMNAIKFLGLSLQPVCDLEVWLERDTVRLRSNRCVVEGYEPFNQRFTLNLQGYLVTQSTADGKKLRGQANLGVGVDLPQAMRFTPRPLVEGAGNGVLNGILVTLKQRLMRQLIDNYCQWASSSEPSATGPSTKVSNLS